MYLKMYRIQKDLIFIFNDIKESEAATGGVL